jgi:threonine dehydrogenase-like Zn-dependent dehydrogenase
MMQAMLYGAGDLRLERRPLDPSALGPNEVFVHTEVTALSTGTDLGNYEGRSTEVPGAPDYPRPVGYSNAGVIEAAGASVSRFQPGQRVFSTKPHQSAYIAPESDLLIPIPACLSSEQASLAYLTQLGLAALRQTHYEPGETVAVVGLGVIGLATVGLARALGAQVLAVANSPARAEAALRAGAHSALLSHEIGSELDSSSDIVILTANTWDAFRVSVKLARTTGRVGILGFPGRAQPAPGFNPLDPSWFYGKQLSLVAAGHSPRLECLPSELRFNLRRNLACVLNLMASGELALDALISHRFPAERMREAYELARQHSKDLVAAVFDWRQVAG